jgi:hypothetical protein
MACVINISSKKRNLTWMTKSVNYTFEICFISTYHAYIWCNNYPTWTFCRKDNISIYQWLYAKYACVNLFEKNMLKLNQTNLISSNYLLYLYIEWNYFNQYYCVSLGVLTYRKMYDLFLGWLFVESFFF